MNHPSLLCRSVSSPTPLLVTLALLGIALPASADLTVRVGQKPAAKPTESAETPPPTGSGVGLAPRVTPLFASTRARQLGVRRRRTPPVLPPVGGGGAPRASARGAEDAEEEVEVNARLGRMVAPADAYRLPDARSQRLALIKQDTQVAIVSQWQGWYAIIMRDGSQAYVPQTHVEVLPYVVKTVAAPAPAAAPAIPPARSNPGITPTLSSRGAFGRGTLRSMRAAFAEPPNDFVRREIEEAFKYEGVPYVWGGNGFSGVDCSGFVRCTFLALGVSLPRRASEQAQVGTEIPLSELQPGDRLYFSGRRTHDHTGIYLGNGYFIHAGSSRRNVGVDHLSTPYYKRTLASARR